MEPQREPAEDRDHAERDQMQGLDAPVPEPEARDLHHRGDDGHGGGDVDVVELERREEQQQREQVVEEFHPCQEVM